MHPLHTKAGCAQFVKQPAILDPQCFAKVHVFFPVWADGTAHPVCGVAGEELEGEVDVTADD
jgi:hypothetical protein